MTISVLGSTAIANGGTYTPNSGTSNRLMIVIPFAGSNPPPTLTNVVYNGVTRTPYVSNSWSGSVLAAGACIFIDSELSSSAQTVTANWSATPGQQELICITVDGAFQSSSAQDGTGGPFQSSEASTSSQGITGINVGDLVIGFSLNRADVAVTNTTSGWTDLQQATIPSGSTLYDVAYHIATATSDTYALSFTGTTDIIMSLLAIAVASGSTGAVLAGTAAATVTAAGALGPKHVVSDLVFETTTTTGTSPFALGGAVTGYRSFGSAMADQDTCLYLAQAVAGGAPNGPYEIGIGTYNLSTNTLTRTQVLRSSNANAAVVFPTGTTNVYLTEPSHVLWNKGCFNAGNSGSAITIDWSNGPYQMVTLTASAVTISFVNTSLCPHGVLELYQDGTGSRVPTISGASYRSGSPPTWSTAAGAHDTLDIHNNAVTGLRNVFLKT